jgi:SAM-dependent methyltransferase
MSQIEMRAEVGQSAVRPSTWPFWAPTPDDAIERALDIAGVRKGDHLLDLGSGDGRVLEAAARRGATATGYEANPAWLEKSRARLAGVEGVRVVEADFNEAPLDADVIFAFLSPSTMFRLRDRFAGLAAGTRIVTYGYGIVGWRHEVHEGQCFLYRLPAAPLATPFRPGWREAGIIMVLPPSQTVLIGALFGAAAGRLDVEVGETLRPYLRVHQGARQVSEERHVPVDIEFAAAATPTVAAGFITMQDEPLYVCIVAAGKQKLSRRLDAAGVAEVQALGRELVAGRRPLAHFIESARPAAVVTASS